MAKIHHLRSRERAKASKSRPGRYMLRLFTSGSTPRSTRALQNLRDICETARLLRANPHIHIDAVDASSSMLQALVRRAGPNATRVRTHLADARQWNPSADSPYDLVVTHFVLDCLTTEEILSFATRLRSNLSPAALWIVSEFAIPPTWYGRLVARPLIAALYRAFGLLTGLTVRTLPDYAAALRSAGFTLFERRPRLAGLLVSELWTVRPSNPA